VLLVLSLLVVVAFTIWNYARSDTKALADSDTHFYSTNRDKRFDPAGGGDASSIPIACMDHSVLYKTRIGIQHPFLCPSG
jgi:hypothetical protein